MHEDNTASPPSSANDNPDPLADASSALDWLYGLRRELLDIDPATMPFDRRRQRQEMLSRFPEVEKLLLAEL
jgi:hypothetical protein